MGRKKSTERPPSFDPELSRGIIAVLLVVLALLIVLSFFDKAGTLGVIIDEWILSFLFGSIRYITPVVLLVVAGYIVKDSECEYKSTHIIGAILFYLAFTGLIHLRFGVEDMWNEALAGHGGGVVGMVAWPLKTYVGTVGSIIIFIGAVLIASLLLFNRLVGYINGVYNNAIDRMHDAREERREQKTLAQNNADEEEDYDEAYEDAEEEDDEEEEDEEESFSSHDMEEDDEDEYDEDEENDAEVLATPARAKPKTAVPVDSVWSKAPVIKPLPKHKLLTSKRGKPTSGDIKSNQKIIQETLKEFRIGVTMGEVRVGPTVTQYTFKPNKGIKVSRITALSNDLALALAAHPIRIEAPIPGKSLIGVEVPNEKTAMVTLRELLESKQFVKREHDMMIALGRDVAGKVWFADLPKMPHLLIAGATGSGKTICMHTLIMSLLFQNTAETLRMIMVDPKRVELTLYNGIPHLLAPVITNTNKTVNALKWTIGEMDRRFEVLSKARCRDITSYNKKYPKDKLPHIVFLIDELADLMATAANDVESGIIRLAQLARAVGIHLIVATQRPSVDVITGLMKANIPGRISFSVASLTDSRTILDAGGAEKLLGKGDMLHLTAALSKPVRIQGAFISESELHNVVNYLKVDDPSQVSSAFITDDKQGQGKLNIFGGGDDDQDALFHDAKQAVVDAGKASASFLQRKLKVGYARAARILDELEAAGIIGPSNGSKPRDILITKEEAENIGSESHTMDAGGEHNVFTEDTSEEEEEDMDDEALALEEEESEEEHMEDDLEEEYADDEEDVEERDEEDTEEEDAELEEEEDEEDIDEEEYDDEDTEEDLEEEDEDDVDEEESKEGKKFFY